jgi:hypothetical protein
MQKLIDIMEWIRGDFCASDGNGRYRKEKESVGKNNTEGTKWHFAHFHFDSLKIKGNLGHLGRTTCIRPMCGILRKSWVPIDVFSNSWVYIEYMYGNDIPAYIFDINWMDIF